MRKPTWLNKSLGSGTWESTGEESGVPSDSLPDTEKQSGSILIDLTSELESECSEELFPGEIALNMAELIVESVWKGVDVTS